MNLEKGTGGSPVPFAPSTYLEIQTLKRSVSAS